MHDPALPNISGEMNMRDAQPTQQAKPTSLVVVGWVWIVLGGMAILTCAFAMIGMGLGAYVEGLPITTSPFIWFLFAYPIQGAMGVWAILSGRAFHQLRRWGRTSLEVMTWILLAWVVLFTIIWCVLHIYFYDSLMSLFLIGFGIVNAAIWAIPLILMLRTLRSPLIRELCCRTGDPAPSS